MPSEYQSRCPEVWYRFSFVMCGVLTNSYPAAVCLARE
ncbi:Uncharacterised protein [Mycobacteroides abscessus subsp. massiliense]|nr:Uncharacterised protein [Mycobacteroides abscessus subsp. massiliense]